MDNQNSKIYRCCGSLLRKQRQWPPATLSESPPAIPAGKLRRRQIWQPQAWNKAHFLCALLVLFVLGQKLSIAGEADPGSGTLTFHNQVGSSFEAPRLHTQVRLQISGIIARVEVRNAFG